MAANMVPEMKLKSDIELVQEVIKGNRKSFGELVNRHQRLLLRICLRFTRDLGQAEDVVQESFMKAFQKIESFEGRSSFKSWLIQIAVNTAKNKLRAQGNDHLNIEDVHLGVDPGAESGMVQTDIRQQIQIEVERLPDKQKLALTLRIFEDLSFKEIAQIMECPYDTAKANYRHALLKLKERINRTHSDTLGEFDRTIGISSMALALEAEQ